MKPAKASIKLKLLEILKKSSLSSLIGCNPLTWHHPSFFTQPTAINILRLVVKKSPTGESTHYFFHSQDDKVEVSC